MLRWFRNWLASFDTRTRVEVLRASLSDLDPKYRVTCPVQTKRQFKPVQRWRKSA